MLRTRLWLNLLPFLVALVAMGAYASVLFSRLAAGVDPGVSEHYRSILAAQEMSAALEAIGREAWLSAGTAGAEHAATLAQQRARFEQNLDRQLSAASLPGERELNQQLAGEYRQLCLALAALSLPGSEDQRHATYERQILPGSLLLKALLQRLVDLNQQAILAAGQAARKMTRDAARLMALGMALALGVSAYGCYRLSHSVLRPIQLMIQATRDLGGGTLKAPVPVLSQDELGQLATAFNKLAAQLEEYRQSTTEEIVRVHRRMETTLATFPDPIFVLNKAGGVELANPAAAAMAAHLQVPGRLPGRLQAIAQQALARGEDFLPHSFDAVVTYRLQGAERSFLPRVLTMRDKEQAPVGVAVVLYDVTRFRLLDAAKTHLVGTVSHELKTPLTSVRMALYILLEQTVGSLTPKQQELLEAARTDTERLLRILNDLLDLARLEEGAAELHREEVPPQELLETLMTETAESASAKRLQFICDVDPNLPRVLVDRQQLGCLLANLMTNAIKHSPAGGEIRLRAARGEDQTVRLSVGDDGPGIPQQFHQRIFDRFFRVPDQPRTGAGLGLSIAREIAVAHGGRLQVKNTTGRGATFELELRAVNSVPLPAPDPVAS
jgi:signal transduction histidine kinase